MKPNPYESPCDLSAPQLQQAWPPPAISGLRAFGVWCGLGCTLAFFSLMAFVWQYGNRARSNPDLDYVEYTLLTGVALIFIGCLVSLVAILIGNATSNTRA
jgi:hypothetical protein